MYIILTYTREYSYPIVIQLNMYVKIITSSGFKSTIFTDFVQRQLRCFGRVFGRCLKFSGSCTYLPEVVISSAGSSTTRAARHKMEKKTKKRSRCRIYDLGVVPTRGNKACRTRELSAELTVTRAYWREQVHPVCGEILRVPRHACQKSLKILPHTGGFCLRQWSRVNFCSADSSRVRQA